MASRRVQPARAPAPAPATSRARWLPPVLLVLAAGLLLAPYLLGGRAMLPLELIPVFQPWARHRDSLALHAPPVENPLLDSLQQYYPRRVHFARGLAGGWLPLWDPFVYGGSPFLGAQQGAVLYPLAWLLALLPPELQFGWSAWLHLSLAAVGAWLFFRQLRIGPAGAAAGAAAFSLNGFVVVWLSYPNVTQWTLCWLPLALYVWERGRAAEDLRWTGASGAVLGLSILGGHGQSSAYVLLAWGAWAFYRCVTSPSPARALARWLLPAAALAVLLSAGHLLPVLEYVPHTDRGGRVPWKNVVEAGMPLTQLWTFLLPRLFGDNTSGFAQQFWLPAMGKAGFPFVERSFYPGAAVLVLAAGAVSARGRGDLARLAVFGAALTAAGVLLAMGTPLYWPLWAAAPGFGHFTATARIICLAAWGLACLAAVGVHGLAAADPAVRRRAGSALAAAAAALAPLTALGSFIFGGAAPPGVEEYLRQTGRPTAADRATRELALALVCIAAPALLALLAGAWGGRPRLAPGLAAGLCAGVAAADLLAFGAGYNPAADPALLHMDTPELQALRSAPAPFRMLSIGPPGAELELKQRMPSNVPGSLGFADQLGSDSFVPRRYRDWEAATARAAGGSPWSRPGAPNLRAAGVRYYLTGSRDVFPEMTLAAGTGLQEDPRALPYARVHTRTESSGSAEALLHALSQPQRFPGIALVSGTGAPRFQGAATVHPYAARRVTGNRLSLTGEAPEAGLLVVCEGYNSGWKARVDGRTAAVWPADHLLLGVPVPAGRHTVELRYAPDSFRVGLFGSLLAVAVLAALAAGGIGVVGSSGGRGTGRRSEDADTGPA